ncbi:DUF4239 domain-containing protein [Lichenibacterium dinghuense]|uniref:bestrophin-like domain n=1 Tax=Lichenibacterium dinghuense TaxID=2895977 RepID=UPI001F44F56D|nr:DUF4239 domain-containing protein [Lichenibacterium sp. 6Y81]
MLQAVMHPETVYRYSIWAVALSLGGCGVGAALLIGVAMERVLPASTRQRDNALTAAILSIVGLTFGVLLAFVAMLAWERFDAAETAASHEAALLLDLGKVAAAMPDPERTHLLGSLAAYARAVRELEWPDQAEGRAVPAGSPPLDRADAVVIGMHPQDIGTGNLQAALIAGLTRLRDARNERRAAAESQFPPVIWVVVVAGGAATLMCAALLGTASLRLHLALTSLLSLSGVLVLVMIVALGHPFQGDLRVTPKAFTEVEDAIGAPLREAPP